MGVLKTLLRLFAFVFHGLLAVFLIAVSGFALAAGTPSLQLTMLPWTGMTLAQVVLGGAVLGLISVLLAMAGRLRWLFVLWSLAVVVLLIRGYVFSGYHFEKGGVSTAGLVVVGSLLALLGACSQAFRRRARAVRY